MHECPDCGEACYCDVEDVRFELDDDCVHACSTTNDDADDISEEELNEDLR